METPTEHKTEEMQQNVQQGAQRAKEEMKQHGRQAAEAVKQGVEELRERKTPISAAMTTIQSAPESLYVGLAAGSIVASLTLYGFRKRDDALFVGQWAPTFLALGLFAKLMRERGAE